jgi:hypothetical protein
MKTVLVIYYSNSGDVEAVLGSLMGPLRVAGFEITWQILRPIPPYPFPWPAGKFFEVFPDALGGNPPPLAPLEFDPNIDFDLVIIGWQVWFLRPSPPIQAFFRTPHAKALHGKRVISVCCSRQMWQRAYQQLSKDVAESGGYLTDNIAVTHRGGFSTFITTPHMLTTGKRDGVPFLRSTGLDPADIAMHSEIGDRIRDASESWRDLTVGSLLRGLDTARYAENYVLAEKIGNAYMSVWGCSAHLFGGRGSWSRSIAAFVFGLALLLLIPIVVPLTLILTLVAKSCGTLAKRIRSQS